jgi:hypothetical protein
VAGRVNKNYLERSLLSMMTTSERQVQTFPYPDNIKEIVLKIARVQLV